MNALARVVHNMVAHRLTSDIAALSQEERQAVEKTTHLLRLSPQDLSAFLADQKVPEDWLILPSGMRASHP